MKISFDSKGDFDVIRQWLNDVPNRKPKEAINQIANEGTKRLASGTPRDTGETANGWISEVETKGHITEIAWKNRAHPGANVNVAKLIHLGHGTGTGGYVPPVPYINTAMDPVFKSAGDRLVKELVK